MPIVPNFLERLLFFNLNWGPGPLLDLFGAVSFRIVLAALKLNVFEVLHTGPLTAAEVAQRVKADLVGITVLLETLESLEYVIRQGERYANSAMTEKWLVRSSPDSIAAGYDYWSTLLTQFWDNLEESIRSGQPPVNLYEWVEDQPQVSADFQAWMVAAAHLTADEIVAKVKLPPTARRLLDVGGGHGMYSIALCRQYPALTATIFDSPQALQAAQQNIDREGAEERIGVQAGNFLTDALGQGYDVVLIFNIVHGFSPEQNTALLRKAAGALNPGGMVIIAEQIAGRASGSAGRAVAQILGMSYFHLLGGRVYAFEEIAAWLAEAGFTYPRRKNLLKAPGNSLVIATLAR
jgi:2-polyprenyl-3-methyl-5-hydroxy-6-metoxy-1,4-benzoquinol methylase